MEVVCVFTTSYWLLSSCSLVRPVRLRILTGRRRVDRAHGDDERLSIENVGFALQFLYEVIVELN
jgi:acetylornithine deacetylase/succinyl-diaminopimelate desuccinylase-like protein